MCRYEDRLQGKWNERKNNFYIVKMKLTPLLRSHCVSVLCSSVCHRSLTAELQTTEHSTQYTVHCSVLCPCCRHSVHTASVAGYSGWKTGVFDKSILCHHLIAFFSCLPESSFCPDVSVCPRPLPVVSLCRLGPAPSRLRVSGSYPPPSHSRHSESSLKSPKSQSSES